jgi:hypothetical protein
MQDKLDINKPAREHSTESRSRNLRLLRLILELPILFGLALWLVYPFVFAVVLWLEHLNPEFVLIYLFLGSIVGIVLAAVVTWAARRHIWSPPKSPSVTPPFKKSDTTE